MNNLVKLLLVFVVILVLPLAIGFGIYFDILPQSVQIAVGLFGVFSAAAVIVGGNLYMMYSDIKTGRYSKRT